MVTPCTARATAMRAATSIMSLRTLATARQLAQTTLRRPIASSLLGPQRRWAAVHDVRFLATTQAPSRSVTEKYREQLERKAKEEGHGGITELKDAYKDKIKEYRKSEGVESVPGLDALLADEEPPAEKAAAAQRTTTPDGLSQPPPPSPSPTASTTSSSSSSASGAAKIPPLHTLLDLPVARTLSEPELSAIWRHRHSTDSNSLCAIIPSTTFSSIESTARKHPIFILPVPRGDDVGAEIHFLQWVFDSETKTATVLFTQLAEYKARGEFAQPHTSVTHYFDQELAEGTGVVLMSGSLVDGRGASLDDSRWLLMLMQRFYGEEGAGGKGTDRAKRELLEAFGRGDTNTFTVERLLEESERLG